MPVVSKVVSTHCAMRDMAGGVGVSCLSSLSSLPSSPSLSVPCDLGIRVFGVFTVGIPADHSALRHGGVNSALGIS